MFKGRKVTTEEVVEAYTANGGNGVKTGKQLDITPATVRYHVRKAGISSKPLVGGQTHATKRDRRDLPPPGQVKRYLCTSAQNNTEVWRPAWENLLALRAFYDAELLVSSFTYNQNAYGKLSVKRGTKGDAQRDLWYADEVEPYLDASDRDIELAPGLVWCGRMNILPTAADPLAGFETYTGRASGIFPHVKHAMRSVASGKWEATKFNYTTGTVTKRNYVQKAAGLRAEFHHIYGALLVEVDHEGRWWVRQLSADDRGRIYDIPNLLAEGGEVYEAEGAVEAVTWGDIHVPHLDPGFSELAWAPGGILDTLRPRHQILHDVVDLPRNHHDMRDPHVMFEQYVEGREGMEDTCRSIVDFLSTHSYRDWCTSVVVDSNHDNMLDRWLREADYRRDPPNALFFLDAQTAKYRAIAARDKGFHSCEVALRRLGCEPRVKFLREDESYVVCRGVDGGIECGQHGHLGPNGSRGTPKGLAKQGRRSNTGHTHSAGIWDGQFVGGTSSSLDLTYNRGPSSWSISFIATFRNGKRQIVTVWDNRWHAGLGEVA